MSKNIADTVRMRFFTSIRFFAVIAVACVISALIGSSPVVAAGTDGPTIWSDDVQGTTTKTGSVFGSKCGSGSANATEESDTLALMDDWATAAVASDFTYLSPAVTPADDVSGDSAVLSFPGVSDVSVTVSRRQVPPVNATNPTDGSTGALSNNSKFSDSVRLQDCAPRPADLTTAPSGMLMPSSASFSGLGATPATFWNATTFPAGNQLDGALFEFSRPVGAFGLWFGDLETRPPVAGGGGALAIVKLLDSAGNVIQSTEILPDEAVIDDNVCGGGTQTTDNLGCGNQASRFIGFVEPAESVASMLVIVGEDDSCDQANQCDGITEYLSWIGPMLAEPQPDLVVIKTLTAPAPQAVGDPVSWTITVSNIGQRHAASGWTVTDVFDSGVSGLTLSGNAAEVDCSAVTSCVGLTQLDDGDSITVTASGIHEAGYDVDVHNVAYVSPAEGDIPELVVEGTPPNPGDDTAGTETNNDANTKHSISEPPPETTSETPTTEPPATDAPPATDPTETTLASEPSETTEPLTTNDQPPATADDQQVGDAEIDQLAFTGSSYNYLAFLALALFGAGSVIVRRSKQQQLP